MISSPSGKFHRICETTLFSFLLVCYNRFEGRETRPLQKDKGWTLYGTSRKKILSSIVGDGFPVPKPYGLIAEAILRQIPSKFPVVSVDKYIIMPDHIHILLRIDHDLGTGNPSPTLGNIVGWYKYQVTKQINFTTTKCDRIFQRSYYDHVIRNQKDQDEIWEYIENNPRKWLLEHLDRE